jgi:hypothetical protein
MQHANPSNIVVKNKGVKPELAKQIESAANLVYGMFDRALGNPRPLILNYTKAGRAFYVDAENSLNMNETFSGTSTIFHEILHSTQEIFPSVNNATNRWALSRIGTEQKKSLNELMGIVTNNPLSGVYSPFEEGYKDKVDNPYTLKEYSEGLGRFREVLTMAFTDIKKLGGKERNDKGLLRIAIYAIQDANGYYK